MNILVDSCSYTCQNVGDQAMLTVAVTRLRELWPRATIRVLTAEPHLVRRHCGDVGTVPVDGRRHFLSEHLLGRGNRWLAGHAWQRFEDTLRFSQPRLFSMSADLKDRVRRNDAGGRASAIASFVDAVHAADLLVVSGAGILNDSFPDHTLGILATIDLAIRRGIPAALVGQGVGPLTSIDLRRRAAEVLPRAGLIAVRESNASVPILRSLGVAPSRIVVTGDDAIELALAAARDHAVGDVASKAIGVNLRVAAYAGVESDMVAPLRHTLLSAAAARGARLIGIPIAHHHGGMDVDTLRGLIDEEETATLDTPRGVIDRIGACRLVVTGSYHGAVFALAQGIPVVALVNSPYYEAKMAGVADQFGLGCDLVRLDRDDFPGALGAAIARAWESAEMVREPLLRAAEEQVRRGRAAYGQLRDLGSEETKGVASPLLTSAS